MVIILLLMIFFGRFATDTFFTLSFLLMPLTQVLSDVRMRKRNEGEKERKTYQGMNWNEQEEEAEGRENAMGEPEGCGKSENV